MLSETAALLTVRMASVAVVINCVEILFGHSEFGSRGIYSWDVIRTGYRFSTSGWLSRVLDRVYRYPRFLFVVAGLLLAATGLGVDLWPQWRGSLLTCVLLGWLLVQFRLQYGLDGSDQMLTIVLGSMWIYYLTPEAAVRAAAMGFVALQLILSYVTAGLAKLLSPEWRSGLAMPEIMQTRSYGTGALARAFRRWPLGARAVCWAVILFECLAFVAVFSGPEWCLWFIGMGVLFHLSIAVFMGLNCFFWSFASTYPSVLVFSMTVEAWRSGKGLLALFA